MKTNLGLLGIGGILFYLILSISWIFEDIIRLLVISQSKTEYSFWLLESLQFIVFSMITYFIYRFTFQKINKIVSNIPFWLFTLLIIYLFVQVLQYLQGYYLQEFFLNNYLEKFESYYDSLKKSESKVIYSSVFHYLKIISSVVLFYCIYQKSNLTK